MRNLLLIGFILSLVFVWSCGSKDGDSTVAETAYTPLAGGTVSIDGLGEVPVISVSQLDENPSAFTGLVAIEGKVAERFEDRFAFVLVDCGRMEGCGSECCSQATVPVRLDRNRYSGVVPMLNDNVLVIGGLTVTDGGYELDVSQVQGGAGTVIKKTGA
jgi:hypothetical protein